VENSEEKGPLERLLDNIDTETIKFLGSLGILITEEESTNDTFNMLSSHRPHLESTHSEH
jgi:hypothetical protein